MSAETKPQWDRYTAALPSIAAAVGRTPLVRLNRITRDVKPAIYVKVDRRQLPGVTRIGRRLLFRADDLLDWLDQKRAPSPEE